MPALDDTPGLFSLSPGLSPVYGQSPRRGARVSSSPSPVASRPLVHHLAEPSRNPTTTLEAQSPARHPSLLAPHHRSDRCGERVLTSAPQWRGRSVAR